MDRLRVISYTVRDAAENMALDEAIAVAVGAGRSPPTLRLYGWDPPAVSIGYFQEVEAEVNLDFCEAEGISVVRRLTGGGAVLHASGELTYSFAVSERDPAVPQDIQGSYMKICSPIVSALRDLGAPACFKPINDIEVSGRKVSGNAQTRRFGAVLQHGTLLLDIDAGLLGALRANSVKLGERGITAHAQRVTALSRELGRRVTRGELSWAVKRRFKENFGCKLDAGQPTGEELCRAQALADRYRSVEWLFRR